jgi:hypothetical protein
MATKRLVVAGGSGFLGSLHLAHSSCIWADELSANLMLQDPGFAELLLLGAGR